MRTEKNTWPWVTGFSTQRVGLVSKPRPAQTTVSHPPPDTALLTSLSASHVSAFGDLEPTGLGSCRTVGTN